VILTGGLSDSTKGAAARCRLRGSLGDGLLAAATWAFAVRQTAAVPLWTAEPPGDMRSTCAQRDEHGFFCQSAPDHSTAHIAMHFLL
jgi:hypothetical protein